MAEHNSILEIPFPFYGKSEECALLIKDAAGRHFDIRGDYRNAKQCQFNYDGFE